MAVVTFGWAVLIPDRQGWYAPGSPSIWTVRATRNLAMDAFAETWALEGEDASHAWKRAYRKGWRLSRVSITPAFGDTQ